ncbi:MAG: restriction endonuclease subunit M, partial [Muribaculaceae bacterium]
MDTEIIDIREDDIRQRSPELLATLLKDHTMSRVKGRDRNIFWATSDYEHLGEGFRYGDQILPENITGEYGKVVQPRVCKSREAQQLRVRDKAEVFTPSWICNAQNNLIDEAWFGRNDVFNH